MTPDKASAVLEYLVPQLQREADTTSRVLAAVPDEKCDYRPSEKCMTARELARHIATADVWFLESIAKGQFERPDDSPLKDKSSTELVEAYKANMAAAIDKVKGLSGEQLVAPLKFYVFEMPALDLVSLMLKHSVHHRGQLSAYLRPMGAKVPAIYGGSADEPVVAPRKEANAG